MITIIITFIVALVLISILITFISETTPGFMICSVVIGILTISSLLIDETTQPYIVKNFTNNKVRYTQCKSVEEVTINGEKIILCEFISNDEKIKK